MRKINPRNFRLATRSTTRAVNRQILLNLVQEHQPVSRADLARRMGLGRGMITELVNSLIAEGVVYEGATAAARRGRRPTLLHLRTEDRLAIGVDVRFSRTGLTLCDFGGRQLALETFGTVFDAHGLVEELAGRIARLLETHHAGSSCQGIGLVVPGLVDRLTGRVRFSPQLGWREVDIRSALEAATGLPVQIENAALACALAHLWLGPRSADVDSFVYLTVSDGVGAGIVVNGQVVRGQGNSAGELGHVPISLDGPLCLCGNRGCLEAYTSNLATLARYLGFDASLPDASRRLRETAFTMEDLIARARSGDDHAREALLQSARYLAIGVAALINTLNPGRIYIGGELAEAWDLIGEELEQNVAARVMARSAAHTPITPEPGTAHPRLRGAMALVVAPMFAAPQVA